MLEGKQYSCEEEADISSTSLVGINVPNFFNNCYLNAVFQMLFQMCSFREALISYKGEGLGPIAISVKDILALYQKEYNFHEYKVISPNFDLIKRDVYNRANLSVDDSDDPATLLSSLLEPRLFEETQGIADRYIFNNQFDPKNYPFV